MKVPRVRMSKSLSPSTEGLADNWRHILEAWVKSHCEYCLLCEQEPWLFIFLWRADISGFADAMHFYQHINYFTENEWRRRKWGWGETEGSEKGEIKRYVRPSWKSTESSLGEPAGRKAWGWRNRDMKK